jgi:hypothetical protein
MRLRITAEFTLRPASQADLDRFKQPAGMLELLDSDGERISWCATQAHAERDVSNLFGNMYEVIVSA